ncbi:TetR/AcrR family transcriptional regulator [Ideonella azotifigens]|uniref:TetR/AcrR family transcriptional regulator n=1 Tax=Ideonella azotifigens TaxID=513160 RepID=A0ABN1KKM0_9BURK|nr:TetR/AcrR family transcriptional regulator [Ideonella azotifigens]MCD2339205.1 TetR/AcrR family transcriptional regulator [Ideonella azotifigens]
MADDSTLDRILRSAHQLILQRGFHGFSYADVADQVGIRKPSIHHHFPTKVDLVRTLVANYRQAAAAGLAAIRTNVADPAAQLRAYVGYWERCVATDTDPFCLCALLAAELPSLPPEVAAEVRGHFQALVAWLQAALQDGAAGGQLRLSQPVEVEAHTFMAAVHGALLTARAAGEPSLFGRVMSSHLQRLTPSA